MLFSSTFLFHFLAAKKLFIFFLLLWLSKVSFTFLPCAFQKTNFYQHCRKIYFFDIFIFTVFIFLLALVKQKENRRKKVWKKRETDCSGSNKNKNTQREKKLFLWFMMYLGKSFSIFCCHCFPSPFFFLPSKTSISSHSWRYVGDSMWTLWFWELLVLYFD